MSLSQSLKDFDATPQITLIGKSSAGKAMTIKNLFNPSSRLEDIDKTSESSVRLLSISLNERGTLTILNCMDLRDSDQFNEDNIKIHHDLFEESDVVLWVIDAKDSLEIINEAYFSIITPGKFQNRLVVGINNIDYLEPGDWSAEFNLPSQIQELNIKHKEKQIQDWLSVLQINPNKIVSYSARRNFRLTKLFRAMVDTCSDERIPALVTRRNISSFLPRNLS